MKALFIDWVCFKGTKARKVDDEVISHKNIFSFSKFLTMIDLTFGGEGEGKLYIMFFKFGFSKIYISAV